MRRCLWPSSNQTPKTRKSKVTLTDLSALRNDVQKERKSARRHRFVSTIFGATALGGLLFAIDSYLQHDETKTGTSMLGLDMIAIGLAVQQANEGYKRQHRANRLDETIFKALENNKSNLFSLEIPESASDPAAFDLSGQEAASHVVVTAVNLEEILRARGISYDTLQRLAPIEVSPELPPDVASPPQ